MMLVHLALATTLARSGRGTNKTLGGTRLSPIGQALDDQIERERTRERGLSGFDNVWNTPISS